VGKLKKFLQLPFAQQRLLLNAVFWVVLVRVSLRLMSFEQARRWLANFSGAASDTSLQEVERLLWAVRAASRNVLGSGPCLTQALVAQAFLQRRGLTTLLRIGVAKDNAGNLQAHAWLEQDGKVIIGELSDLSRYTLLPPLKSPVAS
jgi:hypothetical protein